MANGYRSSWNIARVRNQQTGTLQPFTLLRSFMMKQFTNPMALSIMIPMIPIRSAALRYESLLFFFIMAFFPLRASSTPAYAVQTGQACTQCHVDAMGGGPLTDRGRSFLDEVKSSGQYRPLSAPQRVMRLVIGYLHLMAAIMWFGTIMYVHILLKPAYASKGLPKGELRLGWVSMLVLLTTGTLLTIDRVPSFEMLYTTRFGILLSIKIVLFLLMLASAVIVTRYIGPRLRNKLQSPVAAMISNGLTLEQLSHFDGKNGKPSYIGYKGIVYDVSQGRLWKNGAHMVKHAAGIDLTDMLKNAPHNEDKVLAMPQVGSLLAAGNKPTPFFHERLFYFFAYMNLILVFIITFVISLWRWW